MTTAPDPKTPEPTSPDSPGATPEPADAHTDAPDEPTGPTGPAEPTEPTEPAESLAAAQLADRLASVEAAAADLRRMLERSERERSIDRELLAGGVIDLDAARALVEERLAEGATVVEAVARLRERRPLLFAAPGRALRATAAPAASAGRPLDEVAQAARESGDRRLLLDYLRLRRTHHHPV